LFLAVAKELLPAGEVPMIERAVREAVDAGIREVCVVLRQGKEAIAKHLAARGPIAGCRLAYRWQPRPLGMGHALYCARDFAADTPFLLIIPDQFLLGPVSASRRLVERYRFEGPTILSGLVRMPEREVRFFPGARGLAVAAHDWPALLRGKPVPVSGLSRRMAGNMDRRHPQVAGFGRTIYPPEVFPYLTARYRNPATGEVDLWETFRAFPDTIAHRAVLLPGLPVDLGTLDGYRRYLPRLLRGPGRERAGKPRGQR
jgi:UTP--glucose-1-phosphate uridylyltransferase